jgi:hypothetical protein
VLEPLGRFYDNRSSGEFDYPAERRCSSSEVPRDRYTPVVDHVDQRRVRIHLRHVGLVLFVWDRTSWGDLLAPAGTHGRPCGRREKGRSVRCVHWKT